MQRRLVLVALLGALFTPALALVAAPPALADEVVTLIDRAEASPDGTVRVLVQLDVTAVPEAWLSAAGATRQRDAIDADAADVVAEVGAVQRYETLPYVALDATAEDLEALAASDAVRGIQAAVQARPMLDSSLVRVQADRTTAEGWTGAGWNVAVLDSGVEATHPFFGGRVIEQACFASGVSGSTGDCPNGADVDHGDNAARPCTFASGCQHGTHVAGIVAGSQAAANTGPTQGVAPGAGIVAVQVFSDNDRATTADDAVTWSSDIVAGLDWVLANHAALSIASVNLSLGGGLHLGTCDSVNTAATSAINALRAAGVATVVSSGNAGSATHMAWPACISSAVSVGSVNDADVVSSFSNRSTQLQLFAPGESIQSSVLNGEFTNMHGTSMAAPHVAGAWAAIRDAVPSVSVSTALEALKLTGLSVLTASRIELRDALLNLHPTPGPVTAVVGTPGADTVALTWTAPKWAGTAAVTDYQISVTPAVTNPVRTVGSTATSFTFTGLAEGTAYTFSVAPLSTAGTGDAGGTTTTTTGVAPTTTTTEPPPATSGGGGGGGGGTVTTTSTTVAPTTTTTTIAPKTTTTTIAPALLPAPGAMIANGDVVTIRDGEAVVIQSTAPAGVVIVAGAATPSGNGSWSVTSTGELFTAGDAPDLGDTAGARLNAPIVGIAPTPTGDGYWLLGRDGGIFSFGDAAFFGSTGAMRLNQPVVGMSSTSSGRGYWLFAGDGGIFTFGDARFFGSTGALTLNAPITTMAPTPDGRGYWLLGSDGGVFTFGAARFFGSTGGRTDVPPIVAMVPTPTGNGYWLIGSDGRILRFGDAT